jgi:putative oxygen-independent coproporphyrinogen III oxidase
LSEPLGIYIHFPYCALRCPYCDFTLTTKAIPHQGYLDAVRWELGARRQQVSPSREVRSLYFGGGTPGLWAPWAIKAIISYISEVFEVESGAEITLEANPAELTLERARAWIEAGVNRLSLGTQSFNQVRLKALGRTHTPAQARQAVGWARLAGFNNINLDVMHGFQGQSVAEAIEDLESALDLDPQHISLYQLTIEPRTLFGLRAAKGERLIESEGRLVEIYQALTHRLDRAGLPLYEVSNAARPTRASRHNLLYWTLGEYLGVGVGAHGLLFNDQRGAERWENIKKPDRYISTLLEARADIELAHIETERRTLTPSDLLEETLMVGLRLKEGVRITPALRDAYEARVEVQKDLGFIEERNGRWTASSQGTLILDHLTWKILLG